MFSYVTCCIYYYVYVPIIAYNIYVRFTLFYYVDHVCHWHMIYVKLISSIIINR